MLGTARTSLALLLLLAPLVIATAPRVARASEDLVIDTKGFALDGDQSFRTITVKAGGSLGVIPVSKGHGWLHLRANRIVIEAGGTIVASAAGYAGKEGANGDGPGGGKAPTGVPTKDAVPGGGGAHAADGGGGVGTAPVCDVVGAAGGAKYGIPADPDAHNWLGSAGGGALAVSGGTRGGNGGGAIVLEAASIKLDGTVLADGENGLPSSSGAGAGGAIVVRAFELLVGASAKVTALGGTGGGTVTAKVFGGGGSGGFVTIEAPTPAIALLPDVSGGKAGLGCGDPAHGAGGEGLVTTLPAPTECFDLDGDGHSAVECGGDDCDDVDPAIHPGQKEVCDDIDNDCSGKVDDGTSASLCGVSLVCKAGECVATPDAGADAAVVPTVDDSSPPDHLEFTGGCSLSRTDDSAVVGAALLALLAALSRRRTW